MNVLDTPLMVCLLVSYNDPTLFNEFRSLVPLRRLRHPAPPFPQTFLICKPPLFLLTYTISYSTQISNDQPTVKLPTFNKPYNKNSIFNASHPSFLKLPVGPCFNPTSTHLYNTSANNDGRSSAGHIPWITISISPSFVSVRDESESQTYIRRLSLLFEWLFGKIFLESGLKWTSNSFTPCHS